MIYHGTYNVERIAVQSTETNGRQFIELTKFADAPIMCVDCSYDDDWHYEFYWDSLTDYELIKFHIMSEIFECDTMKELLGVLSEVFEDVFGDIIIEEECDGDCAHCERNMN